MFDFWQKNTDYKLLLNILHKKGAFRLLFLCAAFYLISAKSPPISLFFAFHPEAAFLFLIHKFIIHKKDEIYFYISPFDYA